MVFVSFDPRNSIRDKVGINWDVDEDGTTEKCLVVTDNHNDPLYIPMYFSERIKSAQLPTMPYIEMRIVKTYYLEHDIGATTRKMDSYIDLHLYVSDTDNIDREAIAKKVKDYLYNLIRVNQCGFTDITWINVDSDTYLAEETKDYQLVYHYVMTVHALWYDICT